MMVTLNNRAFMYILPSPKISFTSLVGQGTTRLTEATTDVSVVHQHEVVNALGVRIMISLICLLYDDVQRSAKVMYTSSDASGWGETGIGTIF